MISDMRSVRVSQCAQKLSQGAPSLSQGALKVFQGAPTFFRPILLLQNLALWCPKLPQVVSQGVSICVVKIFYFSFPYPLSANIDAQDMPPLAMKPDNYGVL